MELLLVQERAASQLSTQGWSRTHEVAVAAQTEYVQSLKDSEAWKTECGEAMHLLQEESLKCHEEHRHYCETYDLWQNLRSAPISPSVRPPGLPVPPVEQPPKPRRTAGAEESRYEEVVLKTKEGDKLHAPSYPSITNLVSWQSALTQQLVLTSGVRDIETVIKLISAVWTKGAKFDDFATSGGLEFVTLDVKLSTAMQLIISHGGQDAKELKDLINRKMDEALKGYTLLKGRQIVYLLLENFKTFDKSEMGYGFEQLVTGP